MDGTAAPAGALARPASRARSHQALPPLLFALTVATGVVDAVSYLALGHVFVANMTGNVVFLGFAAAGAPGLSVPASLTAMGAFLVGSFAGGALGRRRGAHRGRLLAVATSWKVLLLAVAVLVSLLAPAPLATSGQYALIVLLAVTMGLQNATARRLGIADVTTTVLTLTLTGLASDSRLGGGPGARPARKLASLLTMFAGALLGALLVRHASVTAALVLALAVMASASLASHGLSRGTPAEHWQAPAPRGT